MAGARPARDLLGLRAVAALGSPRSPPSARSRSRSTSPRPRRRWRSASRARRCAPPQYLDRCGLLGPSTVLAHGVWLDRAELELIAERGATMVTNPVANLKLAVGGVFPYLRRRATPARRSGSAPTAPGSNNSLDLLADARRSRCCRSTSPPSRPRLRPARPGRSPTGRSARSCSAGGLLAAGAPADFALVRLGSPALALGAPRRRSRLRGRRLGGRRSPWSPAGSSTDRAGAAEAEEVVARARERAQALLG